MQDEQPFHWRAIATIIGMTASANDDREYLSPDEARRRVNRQLGLKTRFLLEPDRWDKRGAASELYQTLDFAATRSRAKHIPKYAAGLTAYRAALATQAGKPSKAAALRQADDEDAIVGADRNGAALEGNDRDRALLKWLERAEYWEVNHKGDSWWYGFLKRVLQITP